MQLNTTRSRSPEGQVVQIPTTDWLGSRGPSIASVRRPLHWRRTLGLAPLLADRQLFRIPVIKPLVHAESALPQPSFSHPLGGGRGSCYSCTLFADNAPVSQENLIMHGDFLCNSVTFYLFIYLGGGGSISSF